MVNWPLQAVWRPIPTFGGRFEQECGKVGAKLYMPPLSLCGDNGAMIACQGYYEYLAGHIAGQELNAVASLPAERGSYIGM